MFTGIVEELGRVLNASEKSAGIRITVECSSVLLDAQVGASIAINGVCVTAMELAHDRFSADLAPETLRRSNLGSLRPGALVNLERPLKASSRIDGHFVSGHVDGTGEVISIEPLGSDNWWLRLRVPAELTRYIVLKGSVAVNGISLTVAEIAGDVVAFTIIPHTYRQTNIQGYAPGTRVNIEADILAKHLEKLIAARAN